MNFELPKGVKVAGDLKPGYESVLSQDALQFVAEVHRNFEATRQDLLAARAVRQKQIDAGQPLKFAQGDHLASDWRVSTVPGELQCRHVEITGPVDRKMIINALNSGADVFMADFEDSNSPTWSNLVEGQRNLIDANRKTIKFDNPNGSVRTLKDKVATLFVRTRGWHLDEKHLLVDDKPVSGALFDFALYFFHNIKQRLENNSSTYFYLPKMEHHLECRLWNEVFQFAEKYMQVPQGSIRSTVMVETLPAAFETEAMLYELRDYACGMNAGRWDYIFSMIKVLKNRPDCILPDRGQVTMQVPFMDAYAKNIVKICHARGAHAMGGMSAFIPSRRDADVNRVAIDKVTKDKEREVKEGYDGTWVAHPDLVKLAKDIFMDGLDGRDNQAEKQRDDVNVKAEQLVQTHIEGGAITEKGVRDNLSIGLAYLNSWLKGQGAAAINNLMEDAATAEISRAQLWQWLHHAQQLRDGRTLTREMFREMLEEEVTSLGGRQHENLTQAAQVMEDLVLNEQFADFLTLPGYEVLVGNIGK